MSNTLHENEFRMFLENGERLRLQIRGDGPTLAAMLATCMEQRSDVAAMVLTAAAGAMEKRGISSLDLKKLARKSGIDI